MVMLMMERRDILGVVEDVQFPVVDVWVVVPLLD
jgi:hypothetical protein